MQPDAFAPALPDPERERQERLARARAGHWRRARRTTAVLLALWLAAGFGTVFFARSLASLTLLGWPLPFYMAAQGASLVYLAIVGGYAWRMRRLDREYARCAGERA
jgi:putative solute:sodium symporter small subunit